MALALQGVTHADSLSHFVCLLSSLRIAYRMRIPAPLATAWILFGFASLAGAEPLQFNRDVRPILSDNCFQCHGPDEKHREADLRLDVRDSALEDRGGYAAITPGKTDASEILNRIFSTDEDTIMPPPSAHKTLTAEQKETLKQWVKEGAAYEGHWAFNPIKDPPPPKVDPNEWVKNDVDCFVLNRLEKAGLTPSPEADRSTLIRRLSVDLIGLLPSPAEVEAFVNDKSEGAYDRLVDRLLSSPHYGERWGRHWLDQARYADSNGYTIDSERVMWPYRDWVIRALNDDMPFSQFTIEQLAGDLLSNPTKLQLISTGFNRNTMINEEGGTDAEQFRNEIVADRTNTTGTVWLGLTFGCAQCHSHKFDPISHKEYFSFFAFFNSGTDVNNRGETLQVLPSEILPPQALDPDKLAELTAAQARVAKMQAAAAKRQVAWEAMLAKSLPGTPDWRPFAIDAVSSVSNRSIRKLDDGSVLASRDGAGNDTYEITSTIPTGKLAAIRLTVLPHESLAGGGAGTAGNGNFILTEIELSIDDKDVGFAHALADHAQAGYPATFAIDDRKETGWALKMDMGGKGQHEAWFLLDKPIDTGGKKVVVRLRHDKNDHYLIGRFKLDAVSEVPVSHPEQKLWDAVVAAIKKDAKSRTKDEKATISRAFNEVDRDMASAVREAEALNKLTGAPTSVMVMKEVDPPRQTFIHLRGDFLNQDKESGPLTPSTPECLPAMQPEGTPDRLDLARWLVRGDNPLTARVAVNRIWMQYFGQGLVLTEDDFGTQGSAPTHPDLLDWLSTRFMQQGWSMKALHRLIVTSATYRQSSNYRKELEDVDPRNFLLARQSRLRFDAEIVRDAALSASGLLSRAIGGPTVRPPQPEGVYAFTQTKKKWEESQGSDRYRRALYTTFIRSAPYPLFTTFDAPNFSSVCTRRVRSNTPLQALTLANDTAFVELAQGLAVRLWKEVPGAEESQDGRRIRKAFEVCYGREPTPRESEVVLTYLREQRSKFAGDPKAAAAAAPPKRPKDMSTEAGAAWGAVARALMNTDEFITRE